MPRRLIADHIDYWRACTPCVVQICNPVGEAWPEMGQRQRRLIRHPRVAVGCARADSFEQTQHRAHSFDGIESLHQRHLGAEAERAASRLFV